MAYNPSKMTKVSQLKKLAQKVKATIGTPADTSSDITIYGTRSLANEKLSSIGAGSGIEVNTSSPNSATAPKVGVKLSSKTGNSLGFANGSGEDGGLFYKAPVIAVSKKSTANDDAAASYQVTVDGTPVGVDIDIAKDYLVKSATIDTVTSADKQAGGKFETNSSFAVGDKYLDFVVNTKADGDGTAEADSHIYLNVKDLAHVYSEGNGIQISGSDAISVKIDGTNANGLSAGANGLALALAAADTWGGVAATGTAQAGVTYYTSAACTTVADVDVGDDVSSYYVYAKTADGAAGALTSADKYKIDHMVTDADIATDAEVDEMLLEVFGA